MSLPDRTSNTTGYRDATTQTFNTGGGGTQPSNPSVLDNPLLAADTDSNCTGPDPSTKAATASLTERIDTVVKKAEAFKPNEFGKARRQCFDMWKTLESEYPCRSNLSMRGSKGLLFGDVPKIGSPFWSMLAYLVHEDGNSFRKQLRANDSAMKLYGNQPRKCYSSLVNEAQKHRAINNATLSAVLKVCTMRNEEIEIFQGGKECPSSG
jgi:hypothetical protein